MSDGAERGAAVRFPPSLVFLGLTLAGVALNYTIGPVPLPVALWMRIVGAGILLAGVAIVVSARVWFVRTGQSPIPWKPTPELIFRGPYRFTRNPMYVGVTCIQIGLGAAVGILWLSLLAPVALLIVHFIAVRREEEYLSEKFGAPYDEYRARVRRYF